MATLTLVILAVALAVPIYNATAQSFEDSRIRVSYNFNKDPAIAGNYLAGEAGFVDITIFAVSDKKVRVTSYGVEFTWLAGSNFYTKNLGENPVEIQSQESAALTRLEFTVTPQTADADGRYMYKLFVNYEYHVQDFWHPLGEWVEPTRLESSPSDFLVQGRTLGTDELLQQLISSAGALSNSLASVSSTLDRIVSELSYMKEGLIGQNATVNTVSVRLDQALNDLSEIKTDMGNSLASLSDRVDGIVSELSSIKEQLATQNATANTQSERLGQVLTNLLEIRANVSEQGSQIKQIQDTVVNSSFLVKLDQQQLNQIINAIETKVYWSTVQLTLAISIPISVGATLSATIYFKRQRKSGKKQSKDEKPTSSESPQHRG